MLNLVIHHNIHLTRDQRYSLHNGESVECVGVIVPVWTSKDVIVEPAKEVFCSYLLKNTKQNLPIKLMRGGFEITIPYRQPINPPQNLLNEDWRNLTEQEKEELGNFYTPGASSENLLDVADGGSEMLMYREHNKVRYDGNMQVAIVHLVQIRDIKILEDSCFFNPHWVDNPLTPKKFVK